MLGMSAGEMEDLTESFALLWPTHTPPPDMTAMRDTAMVAIDGFHAIDVTRRAKTIGIMLVESTGQMQAAVSGWITRMYQIADTSQILQADSTNKAVRLAELVGHQFQPSDCDRGQAGRYHACHCEKQLVANHFFGDLLGATANIVISREPCRDCWKFLVRLELILGLRVHIYVNGELSTQGRESALFHEWLTLFGGMMQE